MISSRLLHFLLLVLVFTLARGQGQDEGGAAAAAAAAATPDCDGTPGECANPEAAAEAEPVKEEEEVPPAATEPEDPKCPSRPHIIRCAAKHMDTNQNNKLDRVELETAIDSLNWLARGVLKIIGSVDSIMKKCDYDGDGAISIDSDMDATSETCLASCFKRRAFKNAFFPECDL